MTNDQALDLANRIVLKACDKATMEVDNRRTSEFLLVIEYWTLRDLIKAKLMENGND